VEEYESARVEKQRRGTKRRKEPVSKPGQYTGKKALA
jgi:hypothetical protein